MEGSRAFLSMFNLDVAERVSAEWLFSNRWKSVTHDLWTAGIIYKESL